MGTVRILHVSDLHARTEARPDQQRLVGAMLDDAAGAHEEAEIHLAVVTGDLANRGKLDELFVARELLLDGLTERLGLTRERVILLPGNHDVDRAAIDRVQEAGLRALLTSREEANALLDARASAEAALARLEAFDAFRAEFYEGCDGITLDKLSLVSRLQAAGHSVGVAAMNTAWRCSDDHDRGRLLIGDRQLFPALDAIDACEVRIAAFHHPLTWLAPWDADAVRLELEKRLTVVLTGHEHESDPSAEASARGQAVYNRVGCLFEDVGYSNSYALVDVDPDAAKVTVSIRTWWPKRGVFDAAVDLCPNGVVPFDLGTRAVATIGQPSFTMVQGTLAEVAQRGSLLADQLPELDGGTVDDVLVAPRFWSIPYAEVVAAATASKSPELPDEADPAIALRNDVVLISGEAESGLTSALVWLLARRFDADAARIPVHLRFDVRFKASRFERALRKSVLATGCSLKQDTPLPPCAIAVDDVSARDPRALEAFVAYMKEHPQHCFLIGAHDDAYAAVYDCLERHGLACERLFLGPFGRRQLRQLTEKLSSNVSLDLVDRVIGVVNDQALPRTPFIMLALLAVMAQNADPAALNVSGVLNSYVGLLLGRDDPQDAEGLGMDYRRREHLLGWLAAALVTRGVPTLTRRELEKELIDYFERKGWAPQHSAGHVIDSLVRRRVLMEDDGGVGFRHPALRSLFAAKATRDDRDFQARVIADPLRHAAIVTHIAGLERSNGPMLEAVLAVAREAIAGVGDEVTISMFDRIEDRPGWADDEEDTERLKELLAHSEEQEDDGVEDEDVGPPDDDEDEEENPFQQAMDELDESWAAHVFAYRHGAATQPQVLQDLGRATRTLLSVLRNSELVDDLPLKVDATKDVIHGWALMGIVAAVSESDSEELGRRIAELADQEELDAAQVEQWARFSEFMTVLIVTLSLTRRLAISQLREAFRAVVADEVFMADSAHALLATMLYCEVRGPNWIDHLRRLYERHRTHPIVSELSLMWAFSRYYRELGPAEEAQLAGFIADAVVDMGPAPGRAQQRGLFINELRRNRLLHRTRTLELADTRLELGDVPVGW